MLLHHLKESALQVTDLTHSPDEKLLLSCDLPGAALPPLAQPEQSGACKGSPETLNHVLINVAVGSGSGGQEAGEGGRQLSGETSPMTHGSS